MASVQLCLRTWYYSIKHASCSIGNQREKLLDRCRSITHAQLTLLNYISQDCYIVITTYMSCREMLCRCSCNIYAYWPSVTVTNTAAVQTCLLVECCCKMDACRTVATQLACLLTFCMRGSRNFFRGGGGSSQARWPENSPNNVLFCFLVLNLYYSLQRGSNGFITEKTILFSRIQRGSNLFQE